MLVVGLTGSIGMGKSTVAAHFRQRGIAVFDADAAVHDLYAGPAVAPIEEAFPGTTCNGAVDRARLSAALLAAPHRFPDLERIVHPLVRAAERDFLQREAAHGAVMAVLEIPLLFETGGEALVDVVLVVSAGEELQAQRVLERPGMTRKKLAQILARQLPDREKCARADFVVDTSVPLSQTEAEVDSVIAKLASVEGQAYHRHWA